MTKQDAAMKEIIELNGSHYGEPEEDEVEAKLKIAKEKGAGAAERIKQLTEEMKAIDEKIGELNRIINQ
jgi:hypothetical protein